MSKKQRCFDSSKRHDGWLPVFDHQTDKQFQNRNSSCRKHPQRDIYYTQLKTNYPLSSAVGQFKAWTGFTFQFYGPDSFLRLCERDCVPCVYHVYIWDVCVCVCVRVKERWVRNGERERKSPLEARPTTLVSNHTACWPTLTAETPRWV